MIDTSQIDHAIVAHAKWKDLLRSAIATGTSSVSVAQARRDDACDFGHWLHALHPGPADAGRVGELRIMHTAFHREAAHVLELALSRRQAAAETAMASGSPFTRATTDLVMALTLWKHQANQPEARTGTQPPTSR